MKTVRVSVASGAMKNGVSIPLTRTALQLDETVGQLARRLGADTAKQLEYRVNCSTVHGSAVLDDWDLVIIAER